MGTVSIHNSDHWEKLEREATGSDERVDGIMEIAKKGYSPKTNGYPCYENDLSRFLMRDLKEKGPPVFIGDVIEDEKMKLIEEFPDEEGLIEDYAVHAVAAYNVSKRRFETPTKGNLKKICLLLDRYPKIKSLPGPLRERIIAIRKELLYRIVMGEIMATEFIGNLKRGKITGNKAMKPNKETAVKELKEGEIPLKWTKLDMINVPQGAALDHNFLHVLHNMFGGGDNLPRSESIDEEAKDIFHSRSFKCTFYRDPDPKKRKDAASDEECRDYLKGFSEVNPQIKLVFS